MNVFPIIHVTSWLSSAGGGIPPVIRALAAEFRRQQLDCVIVGLADPSGNPPIFPANWPVLAGRISGPAAFGYSPELARHLPRLAQKDSVIHVHGLWMYPGVLARKIADATGAVRIVSPHGMLEPWALHNSGWKKRLAAWAFERQNVRTAACIHATSSMEAQSIRLAGYRNAIAVVPNGVVVPALRPGERSPTSDLRPPTSDLHRALFLSRIHPKKGLLNLVQAWREVSPIGWELLIVGPDECGHLAEVQSAVRACGLEKQILFQGEIMGEAKTQCYRDADVFVLPSFSENFGLVIAEALSCGVPVITTRATPWGELETHHCGWWIETGVEPLAKALREATALSDTERSDMGRRGRQLIEDRYTWPTIGCQMCDVYEWVLGAGPKPGCIL